MLTEKDMEKLAKKYEKKYEQEEKARFRKDEDNASEKIRKLESEHYKAKSDAEFCEKLIQRGGSPTGRSAYLCREDRLNCMREASRIESEIEKAKNDLDRLRNVRYVPPIKTPEKWVEDHYQSLLGAKRRASSESEYSDLAAEFREMEGYKNTAELASECDTKYRELKAQREKAKADADAEKVRKDAEEQKQLKLAAQRRENTNAVIIILCIVICSVIGGFLFGLVQTYSTKFDTLFGFAIVVGIILGLIFAISENDIGAGCFYGCIIGVIVVILIAVVCYFIPPVSAIPIGAIIGALLGYVIRNDFTKSSE